MSSSPAGGASTINGILYQMLWCLVRASKIQLQEVHSEASDKPFDRIRIVLEPSKGGDLQEITPALKVIVQLKTKTAEGAWSLQDLIEEVLTDLYKAVPDTEPLEYEFRFVSDGHRGGWADVEAFFKSLGVPPNSVQRIVRAPHFSDVIPFRKASDSTYWTKPEYTGRMVFEHIVKTVGKDDAKNKKPKKLIFRKTWWMLSRLKFDWDRTEEILSKELNAILLAQIDVREELPRLCDAMLMDLAKRARRGDAEVVASEFFAAHQITAVPLNRWSLLRDRARQLVGFHLSGLEYDRQQDVRLTLLETLLGKWTPGRPILIFSGESGHGKSWLLFAAATQLQSKEELVVMIESTNDGDKDLDRAAQRVWREIACHDNVIPLSQIANRRREILPHTTGRWLTLLIDGVRDTDAAQYLATQPWEQWGIRLAMSASVEAEKAAVSRAKNRILPFTTSEFSVQELQDLLFKRYGAKWASIPERVFHLLRFPILAGLHCRLSDVAWHPTSEYQLYQAFWDQLKQPPAKALDAERIRRLARGVFDGRPPPWNDLQMAAALDNDDAAIQRLSRCGWIRKSATFDGYEIPHERLLNWAVAETLVEGFIGGDLPAMDIATKVAQCFNNRIGVWDMKDVPGDFLFLLLMQQHAREQEGAQLIVQLETYATNAMAVLCQSLRRIVNSIEHPSLFDRIARIGDGTAANRMGR